MIADTFDSRIITVEIVTSLEQKKNEIYIFFFTIKKLDKKFLDKSEFFRWWELSILVRQKLLKRNTFLMTTSRWYNFHLFSDVKIFKIPWIKRWCVDAEDFERLKVCLGYVSDEKKDVDGRFPFGNELLCFY